MILLFLLIVLLNNSSASCGYVDLTATISYGGFPFSFGEFILSNDKCQALSAMLSVFGTEQAIDGAMKFSCDPTNNSRLIVTEYDNALCAGRVVASSPISINEKIHLFNEYLYFMLNGFVCSDSDCSVDITFSDDCTGISSVKYSNFAIPPDSCQTFGDDFGVGTASFAVLSSIPYQILPQGAVDGLMSTALQFKCCESDNSLLIHNYSDTNCLSTTVYNTLRLSNKYNGQCFVLGDVQKPFEMSTNTSTFNPNDINSNHQLYALRFTWSCDEYIDCTNIEFMDETQIPNLCPDKCLKPGYTLPPTISPPTTSPTFDVEVGTVTGAPKNQHGSSHPLNGAAGYVLIGVIIFVIVTAVGMLGLCAYNKRKMKRVVEESQQNQIKKNDPRYEPMIVNNTVEGALPEGNNPTDNVEDNNNNTSSGQYVLPGKPTDGDSVDTNNNANLLSDT